MMRYAARIETLEDVNSVLDLVWRFARRVGATAFSYHQTPIFEAPNSNDTVIYAQGYPIEQQKDYLSGGYRNVDPFPQLTFDHGPVLAWTQAMEMGAGDPQAAAYFAKMHECGFVNGVSMALYGSRNRDAYATVVFDSPPEEFEPGGLTLLHSVLQAAHLRICKLIDQGKAPITLSEREREVLGWMAQGKSGTDIATMLEISPETVRTYTKRIYEKLDASDRVGATVKALKLGLIGG